MLSKEIIEDLKKRKAEAREKAEACDAEGETNMEAYWLGKIDAMDYVLTLYGDES